MDCVAPTRKIPSVRCPASLRRQAQPRSSLMAERWADVANDFDTFDLALPEVHAPMVSGSAESIRLSARTAIQRAPYPQVQRVCCDYEDGVVRLRGTVASYYLKQVAQHVVTRAVPASVGVDNQLEVGQRSVGPVYCGER